MAHQMYNPSQALGGGSRGNTALGYGSGRSYESPMFRENSNGSFDMGFWDPGAGRHHGGDSRYLPSDSLAHPAQGENSGGVSFASERYMYGERAPADAGGRLGVHGIDRYVPMESTQRVDSSRHFSGQSSSLHINGVDAAAYRGSEGYAGSGGYFPGRHSATSLVSPSLQQQNTAWLGNVDARGDITLPGGKRPYEEVSNQQVLGTHTFGQNEAFLSSNPLVKRPRIDVSGDLPVYPQRPGAKDCTHYMLTRTCKFGANCKFDHPTWVPAGGIPDWKEVPSSGLPPERPGEPECSHYMKTGICKFGSKCKFHHPKERSEQKADGSEVKPAIFNVDQLPERPGEPECDYFLKNGNCKFGAKCKFDHPKDKRGSVKASDQKGDGDVPVAGGKEEPGVVGVVNAKTEKRANPVKPATGFNSKGLPIRPGETDCPFYLKMGSCKYGASCRFSHPEMMMVNPTPAIASFSVPSQPLAAFPVMLQQPVLGINMPPQRPGQLDCSHYMKTGECKFGPSCKFNHPANRVEQSAKLTLAGLPRREGETVCSFYLKTGICKYGVNCRFDHPPPAELDPAHAQPTVKLTLAGFPRREGEPTCEFYMKTGTCKYGATCKFDHPPPGEAIAKAVAKASTNEDPSNVENKLGVKTEKTEEKATVQDIQDDDGQKLNSEIAV